MEHSLLLHRQTQESGLKESVSWGTQRTQEVPYETKTPLERGHSTEIPLAQPGKPVGCPGLSGGRDRKALSLPGLGHGQGWAQWSRAGSGLRGSLSSQAVDVQMQSVTLRGSDAEPHPGLESQGRAASMPRLAAETQVSVLRPWEGGVLGSGLGRYLQG